MEGFIMAAQLLLGLSILVILHEFGHFIAARRFGIKVEKFYLFFDAWDIKLFKIQRGDTEYGIGWLPLGGYVKIAGMIDESMDMKALEKPPEPWEFRSKPAWQRLIVMVGGITVNLILGIFIYVMITYTYGEKYLPMDQLKDGIVAYELGQEIGLKTGDKIVAINDKKVERFSELLSARVLLGDNVVLNVERDGRMIDIPIPNDFLGKMEASKGENFIDFRYAFYVKEVVAGSNAAEGGLMPDDRIVSVNGQTIRFFDEFKYVLNSKKNEKIDIIVERVDNENISLQILVDENGKLGFLSGISDDLKFEHIKHGIIQSIVIGNRKAWMILFANIKGMGKLIRGEISAKSLQGPIGIAKIYGGVWDWQKFWLITGLLSMFLAFVNFLPIPALDGGHVAFLSVEAITGKKFSDDFMKKAQIAGMIVLFTLMTFVIGNDIWNLF